ncbi:MAG TPA: IclR family transcriptional regulator [Rhodopila sp.]|jgi:DNA-binding IclR family transcriptional regulator|nr:IclR family transcriptional regulator [Rhodopila sp.]
MAKRAKQQPGIQSVEVAARILKALTVAGRPLPLKDLAHRAQMHPGKAHRYLVSLTRIELVMQDAGTGHYGIGALSISLGLAGLRSANVVKSALAHMPALRDAINETVLLALWTAQGPVVVALEESSRPVFMNIRVGSILPLLTTSTGRVFAAFMPANDTAELIAAEVRRSQGKLSASVLEEARRKGYAAVGGTLVPGVGAVAVPIFDHKSRIAAVLGALGRDEELDMTAEGAVVQSVRETAELVSRQIGGASESGLGSAKDRERT